MIIVENGEKAQIRKNLNFTIRTTTITFFHLDVLYKHVCMYVTMVFMLFSFC